MRLEFRSQGQADQYYKICKRILMEKSRGPEGVRIGIQRIRNAIYRGFGFNSFNEFLKVFVPNERIASWFHSKEQLNEALSRGFEGAIAVVHERDFEVTAPAAELVMLAVNCAVDANERALQRVINTHNLQGQDNQKPSNDPSLPEGITTVRPRGGLPYSRRGLHEPRHPSN
jgi:hypothetical protein